MGDRSDYLKGFMQEFQYPAEAIDFLLDSYDKIWANDDAKLLFEQSIGIYEGRMMWSYEAIRGKMASVAESSGVHVYTVEFLMLLAMSEHMKELYIERGIDLSIYHDSCMDFKAKLLQCKKKQGYFGYLRWLLV